MEFKLIEMAGSNTPKEHYRTTLEMHHRGDQGIFFAKYNCNSNAAEIHVDITFGDANVDIGFLFRDKMLLISFLG